LTETSEKKIDGGRSLGEIVTFGVFAAAAGLLLLVLMVGTFAADIISGDARYTNAMLLSLAAASLIGGMVLVFRQNVLTGVGMALIAGIAIAWLFTGLDNSRSSSGPLHAGAIQCEGAPWINDRRNLTLNTQEAAVDFAVTPFGDTTSYFRFRLTELSSVRVEANTADPLVELRSEAGVELAQNDDVGDGRDARVQMQLAEGTYCVGVRSVGSPATHNVRIGLEEHEPLLQETSDVCFAGDLPLLVEEGEAITQQMAANELKAFRVQIDDGIILDGRSGNADPMAYLFDFNGRSYARDDDGGDGTDTRISMSGDDIDAGEYCLVVKPRGNGGRISVQASEYDEEVILNQRIANGEISPDFDDERVTSLGVIESVVEVNVSNSGRTVEGAWFSFEIEEAALVVLDLRGRGRGDPYLSLRSGFGGEVQSDDDGGASADSRIAVPLVAGRYLVNARDLGQGAISAVLQIAQYQEQ